MRAFNFIVQTNILIAFAAVALALATQVLLGLSPRADASVAAIFFATLLDYNFHRYLAVMNKPEAIYIDKYKWAVGHLNLLRALMVFASAGLLASMFFLKAQLLFLLALLAAFSFLYSFLIGRNQEHSFRLLKITGMKTLLIALVWTSATVFLPLLQSGNSYSLVQVLLLFAERFFFIFAVAIPFDIRDMEADAHAKLNTIPVRLGANVALRISNSALALSLSIAALHYLYANMLFVIPAFLVSIASTFFFINKKALASHPFYHHGILDGCIVLHGVLIWLSFYFHNA